MTDENQDQEAVKQKPKKKSAAKKEKSPIELIKELRVKTAKTLKDLNEAKAQFDEAQAEEIAAINANAKTVDRAAVQRAEIKRNQAASIKQRQIEADRKSKK